MRHAGLFKIWMIVLATSLLSACGGGGGGGGNGSGNGVSQGTIVNGVAQAGVFSSGQAVFKGYSGLSKDKEYTLKTTSFSVSDKGGFSADIGSYAGVLKVEVYGTYTDETTQHPVTVLSTAPLKAAIPSTSILNGMTVSVTPLTDIAVNKAAEGGATLSDASVGSSNKAVAILFGVDDIVKTVPVEPDPALLTASSDTKKKAYTTALVMISQYVAEYAKTSTNAAATGDLTSNDLRAALPAALAQLGAAILINTATPTPVVTIATPAVAFKLQQASANIAANPAARALVTAAGSGVAAALSTAITTGISSSDASVHNLKVFKLRLNGTYAGKISGVQANIAIPGGVTIKTDTNGLTLPGSVDATGVGYGTTLLGKVSADGATLTVGLINAVGFGTGTFATVYCTAPAAVSAADFTVAGSSIRIIDATGTAIPGLVVAVE